MQLEFKSERCSDCPLWLEEAEKDGYVCTVNECMFDIKKELKFSKTIENLYKEFVDTKKA